MEKKSVIRSDTSNKMVKDGNANEYRRLGTKEDVFIQLGASG